MRITFTLASTTEELVPNRGRLLTGTYDLQPRGGDIYAIGDVSSFKYAASSAKFALFVPTDLWEAF